MESYVLKSSVALLILYLAYRVMIRYEVSHQLNRFTGLACVAFSLLFPLVELDPVPYIGQRAFYVVTTESAGLQQSFSSAITAGNTNIVLLIYFLGAGLLLLRCVIGLGMLLILFLRSPKHRMAGFTVAVLDKSVSPFTFFKVLFVGKDQFAADEMNTMLKHEQVHRDQLHSLDVVSLEIAAILFWFHPAMWLFRRDIKASHEYMADDVVLKSGIDPLDYQLMLFKARTGISIDLGNYLSNKTSLTKRFKMMTTPLSMSNLRSRNLRMFSLVALMSVILFLGAFSNRNVDNQVDKIAAYEQGEEIMYQTISKKITYPASARSENRSGTVRVSFTVNEDGGVEGVVAKPVKGAHVLSEIVVVGYAKTAGKAQGVDQTLKDEAVRVVASLGKFVPAQKNGQAVSSVLTIPVKFKLGEAGK